MPASRKLSKADASKLAKAAKEVIVAKGKKLDRFSGGKVAAADVEKMLGPTGNLRAPCIVAGKTILVGFNEEVYEEVLG